MSALVFGDKLELLHGEDVRGEAGVAKVLRGELGEALRRSGEREFVDVRNGEG